MNYHKCYLRYQKGLSAGLIFGKGERHQLMLVAKITKSSASRCTTVLAQSEAKLTRRMH